LEIPIILIGSLVIKEKFMARIHFGFIGFLFVIMVTVTACTNEIPPTAESVSPTETASVVIIPTNALTTGIPQSRYMNEEARISLILPDGWDVAGPFPVSITTDGSYDYHLYNLGIQPEASGGPGTSHLIVADPQKLTIEAFIQDQCSTCPIHPIETVMLGDVSAKRTIVGGGSVPFEIEWFFLEHNGSLIGLSIHDPETLETLDNVLQSIRLE
jgi:hypothetical protein